MTLDLGFPVWPFVAVAVGAATAWTFWTVCTQAAAHTCLFGHRMKRTVGTRLISYYSCPKSSHQVHVNPNLWTTLAAWHCSACQATGEECLGEGTFWKVGPEGRLEVDGKFDPSKILKPWEALARSEEEQKKKIRWLTHEEAYALVRELVEAHRERAKAPEKPGIDLIMKATMDAIKQASDDNLRNLVRPTHHFGTGHIASGQAGEKAREGPRGSDWGVVGSGGPAGPQGAGGPQDGER